MENTMRRVVVTGLGVISPVGNTVEACWNQIIKKFIPILCASFSFRLCSRGCRGLYRRRNENNYN